MFSQKSHLISGMEIKTATQYLKVREDLNNLIDKIYALGSTMKLFSDVSDDSIAIEPHVLGTIGEMIALESCRIVSKLDDEFICPMDIEEKLEGFNNLGSDQTPSTKSP